MNWPVNWIEQAMYYTRLREELAALQVRTQTVTIPSFREPTQQMWEDAYTNQVAHVPPILPGTRLFWLDGCNGIPKQYATVNAADGIGIDPLVRPFIGEVQPRPCLRLLGTRQMFENSQFNPVYSPIRIKGFSLMYDLGMLVKKNLVALIIHFREQSPAWISLLGDYAGGTPATDPTIAWGSPSNVQWWTLKREAAVAAVGATGATTTDGFMPQTGTGTTTVSTETYYGTTLLFAPASAYVSNEHQPFSAGMHYQTIAAALTAQANPLHHWQAFGTKYDASGLKELYFGTPAQFQLINDHAFVYGLFAGDPGVLEVFNV